MLNTKEKFKQIDATLAVEELDNETAAAIQGGAALEVFRHINGIDRVGSFNKRSPQVKANDQISSIKINEGNWLFWEDAGYKGELLSDFLFLEPGTYNLTDFFFQSNPNKSWNDQISSLERID